VTDEFSVDYVKLLNSKNPKRLLRQAEGRTGSGSGSGRLNTNTKLDKKSDSILKSTLKGGIMKRTLKK
jgi:hypothetical protein